ncbi:hypothetical protein [Streptomyces sp. NPDC026589]|uniref:hypothetical protein n=1 Tax=Streptomyces sp. NPDC026589 TaxID=3155609 RepID=UPI0033E8E8E1
MSEYEGRTGEQPRADIPKSRLAEYAEMALPVRKSGESGSVKSAPTTDSASAQTEGSLQPTTVRTSAGPADAPAAQRRQELAALLKRFRATPVLVPLGDGHSSDDERGLLTADLNGIRFILAFSDRQALARYAQARGEFGREWTYQTILGARLLDVAVPSAGVPCGVALDCADGPDGMILPPVKGIVPDEAAIDVNTHQ